MSQKRETPSFCYNFIKYLLRNCENDFTGTISSKLEKAAQDVAQCEVSATRVVVDAALGRIGKSRHGGHKIANISRYCERI